MRSMIFILLLLLSQGAYATEEAWSWLRVEAGLPKPIIMEGQASTLTVDAEGWVLRMINMDKAFDAFNVRIKKSGRSVVARFEPPNTERVTLELSGVYRVSPVGDGSSYEEFVLANTMNGNFLVVSRIRKSGR